MKNGLMKLRKRKELSSRSKEELTVGRNSQLSGLIVLPQQERSYYDRSETDGRKNNDETI